MRKEIDTYHIDIWVAEHTEWVRIIFTVNSHWIQKNTRGGLHITDRCGLPDSEVGISCLVRYGSICMVKSGRKWPFQADRVCSAGLNQFVELCRGVNLPPGGGFIRSVALSRTSILYNIVEWTGSVFTDITVLSFPVEDHIKIEEPVLVVCQCCSVQPSFSAITRRD